jgi:ComF family protein
MLGPVLGKALAALVSRMNFSPELVMPVPLHRRKIRQRGFNQSVVLARHMARSLGLKVDVSSLARSRHTVSQVGLNTRERRRNVAGAFVLRRAKRVGGQKVLLVDDVLTTGATVDECSRVLKDAGAEVAVVTLARAVHD